MPAAYSILPDRFADGRHSAIETGLKACGYKITRGAGPGCPDDVLVTWTVHRGHKENAARKFEAAGGRVIVAEEAYFRRVNGEKCFALALHDHNGAGRWPSGGPERWDRLGIELKPWRRDGRHVLVSEQRQIGSAAMASPPGWHEKMAERLRGLTDRPVVIRWHPKSRAEPAKARQQPPLEAALKDCWSVVTWASAIAGPALVAGVPVFVEAPHHVLDGAVERDVANIEAAAYPDRPPAFRRLAWAQWSIAEIASGAAFERLL
jgi:hypothetical protein